MKHIELVDPAQCRGRNGWFRAKHIYIFDNMDGSKLLEIYSDSPHTRTAPIILNLHETDFAQFLEALLT